MKRLGGFLGLLALAAVLMGQSPGSAPIGAGPGGGGSGGGSGTVTSVSVATANGLSGSVANPTTTPALTLTYTPSGDCTGAAGVLTCLKTNGTAFGALATVTPGTGVATALGVNVGSAGAFVTFNGALGTPSSGVATNLTGTAAGLTAGTVTTNANLTGPITSNGNATAIASQTGTGTKFVVDTSPTLITPVLGVATATSLDGAAIGAITPSTGAFTTLSASSTVSGTGFSTYLASPPAIGGTVPGTGAFTTLASGNVTLSGSITFSVAGIISSGANNLTAQSSNQTTAANSGTITIKTGNNSQASGTNSAGNIAITAGNASGAGSTGNGGSVTITAGTSVGGTAGSIQLASLATANTRLTVGSATAAAGQTGDLGQIKETDAAAAPGAGFAVLKWVAGTNSGSCKLIGYAGTSATPVTVVDNVGASC